MVIKRAEVITEICRKTGIKRKSRHPHFTKTELLGINSYLDMVQRQLSDCLDSLGDKEEACEKSNKEASENQGIHNSRSGLQRGD